MDELRSYLEEVAKNITNRNEIYFIDVKAFKNEDDFENPCCIPIGDGKGGLSGIRVEFNYLYEEDDEDDVFVGTYYRDFDDISFPNLIIEEEE